VEVVNPFTKEEVTLGEAAPTPKEVDTTTKDYEGWYES
jgi:hypothetical protein